jgi:hypothetical protein
LPDEAGSPLGQSTAQSRVKIEPSEPVTVVKFLPGQGFAAMPVVPEVTGAELVVDAVWVVVDLELVDVDIVEDVDDVEDEELKHECIILAVVQYLLV